MPLYPRTTGHHQNHAAPESGEVRWFARPVISEVGNESLAATPVMFAALLLRKIGCACAGLRTSLAPVHSSTWLRTWFLERGCRRRHVPPKDVRGCGSSQQNASSAEQRTGGIFYEDEDWSTGCNVGRMQRSRDRFYLLSFRSQNAETLVVLCGDRPDM